MEKVIILGSTGSIGTQALNIIRNSNDFKIVGLSCGYNIDLFINQIREFKPKYISTIEYVQRIREEFPECIYYYGINAVDKISLEDDYDTLLNSLVGSCGLVPTLNAIENHKKVLLSNKETLVIGGELVKEYLRKYNGTLYPIDSEHSSLWELFDAYGRENIDEITITASGGPFRDKSVSELDNVTIRDVLNHPNWSMGKKITVDSATMMNKGFEVIEAHYLFDFPLNKIKTIINYESLVHAMVKLKNGQVFKGVDRVSMLNPIMRALYYPKIVYTKETHDDNEFHFKEIEYEKYPCLQLAYKVMKIGGLAPTILNSSNEAAVHLFLNGYIKFLDIYKINSEILDSFVCNDSLTLENILKYDKIVKEFVINKYKGE